ncbi:uncharacterized protein LOC129584047 isoform X2 [Paramacrobiotus metropolitanus]|uniref:uncharacterized protein LOC129584047 isoform X2 n=1 Tax=Paramacrobiotus metropolitanus TaxID=2943436 RepID=UPI002445C4CD|nr:uncharacterized protein LOC129584047 isoform X2 [Paramacrobiotus metropolitanus]
MMSSGAQASESTDDWLEEDVELPGDSEYRKINEGIWKEGFRNAVTESKDVSLQKGFEDGFSRCAALSARLGELRGPRLN